MRLSHDDQMRRASTEITREAVRRASAVGRTAILIAGRTEQKPTTIRVGTLLAQARHATRAAGATLALAKTLRQVPGAVGRAAALAAARTERGVQK